jgi:hypothetical protein
MALGFRDHRRAIKYVAEGSEGHLTMQTCLGANCSSKNQNKKTVSKAKA